jgi:hypothetical protein
MVGNLNLFSAPTSVNNIDTQLDVQTGEGIDMGVPDFEEADDASFWQVGI